VYRCLEKREKTANSVNVWPSQSIEKDCTAAVSQQTHNWLHICSLALVGVVVISSAFHFWPFDKSKAWQILCPANSVLLIWILILMGMFTCLSCLIHFFCFCLLTSQVSYHKARKHKLQCFRFTDIISSVFNYRYSRLIEQGKRACHG